MKRNINSKAEKGQTKAAQSDQSKSFVLKSKESPFKWQK